MCHPEQQALVLYSPVSAMSLLSVAQETTRLIAETTPFNPERDGRAIKITYSIRNGIMTVRYWGRTFSIYSPQGDEANHKAVARRLLSVMLSI